MSSERFSSQRTKITSIASHAERPSRRGSWKIAKNLPASFYYAFQGLIYGFSSQRNFRIQVILGLCSLAIGIWLNLELGQLAIIVFTVASVLVLELINTAIEAAVDLAIGRRFHPLARIAKDCAAAAVLIASISSLLIAFLLIVPPLLNRLGI